MGSSLFLALFAGHALMLISAGLLLHPRISSDYLRIHIRLFAIPLAVSVVGLFFAEQQAAFGWWRSDRLGWLMSCYILLLGWLVQRFSFRFFQGDRSWRKVFTLLTLTVSVASVTWFGDDMRWIVLCWGLSLFSFVALVMQKKEWEPAKRLSWLMAKMFAASWFSLFVSVIWLWNATGEWRLSLVFSTENLSILAGETIFAVNVLLFLAAIIPAGQWPFHRWLLASAVIPTPISAVMHAGLVNAGALLLARFAPLFSGSTAQTLLLLFALVSVLIGTGILTVHVDYKRQLVASTMAQMGMMFVQCALGAYGLAVLHLMLHGWFKAFLFLQSGSVVPRTKPIMDAPATSAKGWLLAGVALGGVLGWGYWMLDPHENARLLRALLLGWSLAFAWGQMIVFRNGRWAGFTLLAGLAMLSETFHSGLMRFLGLALPQKHGVTAFHEIAVVLFFIVGGYAGRWIASLRSDFSETLYMRLVHWGEPHPDFVESLPRYLMAYVRQRR
ncbi:MAG: NADH dehydrogenase [Bacillus thermozeamaize]|uniref:NADH dehydrogenase n=1 Tax=Bacillus thermozeamaize TaxID=230954 RepID=A0A1Y3Q068_9BACI|nr:MAG: NADH dehydrogenase [Bacillus thermozeamaize]